MNIKDKVTEVLKSRKIDNIYFVGCGASRADLYPGYHFVRQNSKLKSGHFTANEFNYDTPLDLGENSIVVAASLGGTTPETIQAVDLSHEKGAYVFALTNEEGSPLTKNADDTIVHGFAEDYAAKLEKMVYALKIALEVVNQIDGFENYEDMYKGFELLPEFANDAANKASSAADEFGRKYKDNDGIYVVGSGSSFDVAYSTSFCLFLEMQWLHSNAINSGEFFHGALEIVDKDVPFLLFMNEGATRHLDSRVLTFLQRFDAKVTVIDGKDYGLSSELPASIATYFNPMLLTSVMRVYAESLSYYREHPLTKRRYMWKLEY